MRKQITSKDALSSRCSLRTTLRGEISSFRWREPESSMASACFDGRGGARYGDRMARKRRRVPARRSTDRSSSGIVRSSRASRSDFTNAARRRHEVPNHADSRQIEAEWCAEIRAASDALAPVICVGVMLRVTQQMLGVESNTCVHSCLMMRHALGHMGIVSQVEAVGVEFRTASEQNRYILADNPWSFEGETRFSGHAVLVLPDMHLLADPTIEQFHEVHEVNKLPALLTRNLPHGSTDLGEHPIKVRLDGCEITYLPNSPRRDAWRHPRVSELDETPELRQFSLDVAEAASKYLMDVKPSAVFDSPYAGILRLARGVSAKSL